MILTSSSSLPNLFGFMKGGLPKTIKYNKTPKE